jgi:transcriptional regulator with XRE-family HTH domain
MADRAKHPIKKYRHDNGLTQQALADMLGVTNVTVWRWENRKRTPRMRDLPNLKEKTGLSEADLLGLSREEAAA